MDILTMEAAAAEQGRTAHPAKDWPAQAGDLLYLEVAKTRAPIDLVEWVVGYFGDNLPEMGKLIRVVGDYDTPRIDHNTGCKIVREWGQAYVDSIVGAEFVVFSTEEAFVLTRHEEPNDPEKRVICCLAEAFAAIMGTDTRRKPPEDVCLGYRDLSQDFFESCGGDTQSTLRQRYADAPLLYGWPAPEWENSLARAIARCSHSGGKKAGQEFRGLPSSIAVPSLKVTA